jgi:hypothetical protein
MDGILHCLWFSGSRRLASDNHLNPRHSFFAFLAQRKGARHLVPPQAGYPRGTVQPMALAALMALVYEVGFHNREAPNRKSP